MIGTLQHSPRLIFAVLNVTSVSSLTVAEHISQKLLNTVAYKQHTEKQDLSLPPIQLSHVYGPIAHGVLQDEPKSE